MQYLQAFCLRTGHPQWKMQPRSLRTGPSCSQPSSLTMASQMKCTSRPPSSSTRCGTSPWPASASSLPNGFQSCSHQPLAHDNPGPPMLLLPASDRLPRSWRCKRKACCHVSQPHREFILWRPALGHGKGRWARFNKATSSHQSWRPCSHQAGICRLVAVFFLTSGQRAILFFP